MKLKRKMSFDGENPFAQKPGALLTFKNQTNKALQHEQEWYNQKREKERERRKKSESSSSQATTEGYESNNDHSDYDDNEDLPDFKEGGYHPVHVG